MPVYDDNDDPRRQFDPPEPWDAEEEDAGGHDVVPDDKNTIRCTECRKYFFDDSPRCPHCGHYPLDEGSRGKPVWFWVALILCLGAMGGFGLLAALMGLMRWRG